MLNTSNIAVAILSVNFFITNFLKIPVDRVYVHYITHKQFSQGYFIKISLLAGVVSEEKQAFLRSTPTLVQYLFVLKRVVVCIV